MGSGDFVCDEKGKPIVVIPPLTIVRTDEKTVSFFHTEQRLSPKRVADQTDVHKATVQRAVNAGELPKPMQISSRRVVHRLTDVQDWFARRQKGTGVN
jgi:predicted DNA-binding transcriptional regulator AlpA